MPDRSTSQTPATTPFTAPTPSRPFASMDADRATAAGTARYRARFAPALGDDFHREGLGGLRMGAVGIGTYLGEPTAADDEAYAESIREAIGSGINVVDTAINYRCQRSERAIGRALRLAIETGVVRRDELVVCTKGGYVPLDGSPPMTREGYQGYLRREFYARGVMQPEEVVAGGHCLAPGFLRHQVAASLDNLGLTTVDLYYLHCPEQQLAAVDHETLLARLREAFAALEAQVDAGRIAAYGIATWSGLTCPPGKRGHLSLAAVVDAAREVAGERHHLRAVQLPASLAMPEAIRLPTQPLGAERLLPAIDAARELGLTVVSCAPLGQGKLTAGLPAQVAELFPGLESDAQRALAFARSLPVTTSLVGMRRRAHVAENLGRRA